MSAIYYKKNCILVKAGLKLAQFPENGSSRRVKTFPIAIFNRKVLTPFFMSDEQTTPADDAANPPAEEAAQPEEVAQPEETQAASGGDKTLNCEECGKDFIFTAGEQEFYEEKGFTPPKRCPECRAAKKAAGRQFTKVTCAGCGKETEVPFVPSGDRPVYCRECFEANKN